MLIMVKRIVNKTSEDEVINTRLIHRIWKKKDGNIHIRYQSDIDSTRTTDWELEENFYNFCKRIGVK